MIAVQGFGLQFVGIALSVKALVLVFGNVLVGTLNDRFGAVVAFVWLNVVGAAAFILSFFLVNNTTAILFAVAFGLYSGLGGPAVGLLAVRTFGPVAFPRMIGLMYGAVSVGVIALAPVVSMLFDHTGSYSSAAVISLVLCFVITALAAAAVRQGDRLKSRVQVQEPLGVLQADS